MSAAELRCDGCGARVAVADRLWCCPSCGQPLSVAGTRAIGFEEVDPQARGVWRYARILPEVPAPARLSLGEGWTPIADAAWLAPGALLKLEHLQPTGSYKDRGAAVLMSVLGSLGVRECVEDSSGNAAAAMAAYAAAARIGIRVFIPRGAGGGKLAQAVAYGASVTVVDGDRDAVAQAAIDAAGAQCGYVGHNWHPLFLTGLATLGIEIVEQLGGEPPDSVAVPVGYGNLLLGVWHGLCALRASGAIDRLPRLIAVQTDAYPGVHEAWAAGEEDVATAHRGATVAEGVVCARPVRGREILKAIRESQGMVTTVDEAALVESLRALLTHGYYVEPTSALAPAGFARLIKSGALDPVARHVIVLTGAGLKTVDVIAQLIQQ
jgi:threonine synthase